MSFPRTSVTVETFRELMTAKPFQPFRLAMASGQTYEVRQSEHAFLTCTDLVVGTDIAKDGIPEGFKICSLPYVTSVERLSM